MFEKAIDRQMNSALARIQRGNHRPQGPGARPMTALEHKGYLESALDQYDSCVRTVDKSDNLDSDRDPAVGKIRTRDRQIRSERRSDVELVNSSSGEYDRSRASWKLDTREGWRILEPGGQESSQRDVFAGKISTGRVYGIEMHRYNDVIRMVQFDLDLDNPKNSVILETGPTWVRSEPTQAATSP